jgi:hypothetical protein
MKFIAGTLDRALIEVSGYELALLLTALGVPLGLLETWPGGKLPSDVERDFIRLHQDLLEALEASRQNAEALGPPFRVGEHVVVRLDNGPAPDLQDGEAAIIVSTHPEDATRDYPWCVVRLSDGREMNLPELMLRRP